jgi:primosomal protein N' (replication factor Y)
MYQNQMQDRANFHYPPLYRLIKISVKHKDFEKVEQSMDIIANQLKAKFKNRVLGPNVPLVGKINNYYIKEILLKFDKKENIIKAKQIIQDTIHDFSSKSANNSVRVVVDVDV